MKDGREASLTKPGNAGEMLAVTRGNQALAGTGCPGASPRSGPPSRATLLGTAPQAAERTSAEVEW